MKKYLFLTAAVAFAAAANAQTTTAIEPTNFGSNWSVGVDGGVTTPLTNHAFFGSMRPLVGLHVEKQLTPVFGLGVEGLFGINTSSWDNYPRSATAFDNSYVGIYGKANLMNLFAGYRCEPRFFTIDAVAGAGWGHDYWPNAEDRYDYNYFATKAGLNFNFNVSEKVTVSVKPYVAWRMTGNDISQTSAGYDAKSATFNCLVGLTYNFGKGFPCVAVIDNSAELAALNGRVNEMRAALDDAAVALAASNANAAELAAALEACQNKPATVVKENTNTLTSVRYVFFRIGSAKITADQMPNVEMVAAYLKNHKDAKVVIKGYASPDGSIEVNERLAKARAESVRASLINKYGIKADRITAEGQGIGTMFTEESWNRVAICTIDD